MSTSPHHRKQCDRRRPDDPSPGHGSVRRTQDLFARANPFLDAVWLAAESGVCLSTGCTDCGTLEFRRMLASIDGQPASPTDPLPRPRATAPDAPGALASALAAVDFDLLRLAPRWYDALDIALYHVRDRAELGFVLDDWLRRPTVPVRILDLVLFRHARYGFPGERVADLWIERCLDAACDTEDEGIVESLILACPERVGSDPRALRAALETATRSACVRAVVRRLGDCA
jgi:hypothetical protein